VNSFFSKLKMTLKILKGQDILSLPKDVQT